MFFLLFQAGALGTDHCVKYAKEEDMKPWTAGIDLIIIPILLSLKPSSTPPFLLCKKGGFLISRLLIMLPPM
jgi:hypothetical protein